jgi:rsbT antagonist protein RsbS
MTDTNRRTPIIRLWNRLVVSLQGDITDEFAAQLADDVLHEIAATGASGLALDVTGVWIMDSHLCHVLSNLAESARLMGTPTVICGITPEIAITLETMGARFRRTQTALSLEEALDTLGIHVSANEQPDLLEPE